MSKVRYEWGELHRKLQNQSFVMVGRTCVPNTKIPISTQTYFDSLCVHEHKYDVLNSIYRNDKALSLLIIIIIYIPALCVSYIQQPFAVYTLPSQSYQIQSFAALLLEKVCCLCLLHRHNIISECLIALIFTLLF